MLERVHCSSTFAKSPPSVLAWMLEHGLEGTLQAYGSSGQEAAKFARMSVSEIANYTVGLRAAIRSMPGHYSLIMAVKRAAYDDSGENFLCSPTQAWTRASVAGPPDGLLLVGAPERSLRMDREPLNGFKRVFAGWHPNHLRDL